MRESMEIYPITAMERAMIKAVEKTFGGRVQSRLSLPTCKSRTIPGIRTFTPPLRLLTYESGHFTCYEKRTFLLANDISGLAVIQPEL